MFTECEFKWKNHTLFELQKFESTKTQIQCWFDKPDKDSTGYWN